MGELYALPQFGELIVLKNYFILEIYTLIFVSVILYFGLKKLPIRNIIFLGISVVFYKFITLNLFGSNCCSLQTNYFPSLSEVNILIGIITFGNILGGIILAGKFASKSSLLGIIGFSYLFSIINEIIISKLGLRIYGENIASLLSGTPLFGINLETYGYILVGILFMTSIYGYTINTREAYKNSEVLKNCKKYFIFSVIGVLLTEILLHPHFSYSGLFPFTNIYQDINIIIILILSGVVFLSIIVSDMVSKMFPVHFLGEHNSSVIFILISSFLYICVYFILAIIGVFEFVSGGFLLGLSILGLPVELFGYIIMMNIFIVMFVKHHVK